MFVKIKKFDIFSTKNKTILLIITLFLFFSAIQMFKYFDIENAKLKNNYFNDYKMINSIYLKTISNLENKYQLTTENIFNNEKFKIGLVKNDYNLINQSLANQITFLQKENKYFKSLNIYLNDGTELICSNKNNPVIISNEKIRPMINFTIKTKKITTGFDVDKRESAYKIIVPILDNDKNIVAIAEYTLDLGYIRDEINQITKQSSIVMINSKLIEAFKDQNKKDLQIKDYILYTTAYTNIDDIFILNNIKNMYNFEYNYTYKISENSYVINNFNVNNFNGEPLIKIIIIKDITADNIEKNNTIIIMTALVVLSLLLVTIILNININFFIQKIESTKEYLRTILDSQKNLVIIVEDNTVIDTNKTFLEFFNKNEKDIPNLNICSLFDKINNFNCNLHPEIFQDILDKPDAGYKVSITKNEYEYTFTLTIKHMLHNRAVIVFTDVTEIEKERQQFKESSEIDFLTNIYNRNKFNKFFDIEFEKNRRYNVNISIISFDIDHFKFVNDNFGHDIGDILLKELSMLVKNLIRTTDVFARMGGEEFVILMPNTELRPAIDLANRLNEKIKNNQFTKVDHITCSFGVTQINENDDKETFLKRADTLLYNSKNNGRNMVSHD